MTETPDKTFFEKYGDETIKSLGNRMGDSPTINELYDAFALSIKREVMSAYDRNYPRPSDADLARLKAGRPGEVALVFDRF